MTKPIDRSARVLRGIGVQTIGQGAVLAVTFLVVPLAVARLGEADYGLWMVSCGILNYLTLGDFGLAATMSREIALRVGRGEEPGHIRRLIERTFQFVLGITAVGGTLLVIGYFIAAPHLAAQWEPIRGPFGVLLVAFILVFPFGTLTHALVGLNDLGFYWAATSIQQLVTSAVSAGLLLGGWGLMGMVGGFVAGYSLLAVLVVVRLNWKFPHFFPRRPAPLRHPDTRPALAAGFWSSVNALGNVFLGGLDLLILGVLLDPATVAVYALTIRLPNTFSTQLLLVIWTLMPSLAEASTEYSGAGLGLVLATMFLCQALLVGLVVAVVAGVNASFIAVWIPNRDVYGGDALNAAFLACVFVRQIQAMSAQMLFSLGFNRLGPLTTLADGAATAGLMVAFVSAIGPVGVPLAGILGAVCISLPLNLWALGRAVGVPVRTLLATLGEWLMRMLPVLLLSAAVAYAGNCANGWWERAGVVAFGSALIATVYILVMLPMLRRTPLAGKLPRWLMRG